MIADFSFHCSIQRGCRLKQILRIRTNNKVDQRSTAASGNRHAELYIIQKLETSLADPSPNVTYTQIPETSTAQELEK